MKKRNLKALKLNKQSISVIALELNGGYIHPNSYKPHSVCCSDTHGICDPK